jgi:shikimate kinase
MLILLIGPKGSGKTHIGRLLARRWGVHFFRVESHWMRYHTECTVAGRPVRIDEGIERIHPAIIHALSTYEQVCVETTGASPEILDSLLLIGERFGRILVQVRAPLSLCLTRIAARDPSRQIPMQDENIRTVHALSSAVDLPFDITLENIDLSEEQILRPFSEMGIGMI